MKKIFLVLVIPLCVPGIVFSQTDFVDEDDIPQWAENSVEKVQEAGIMTGFADRTFRPNTVINRAEALVILFRTKGIDYDAGTAQARFKDVSRGEWFEKAVGEATAREWIQGYSDGTFRPGASLTRAEWATILTRAFELEPDRDEIPSFQDVPSKVWFADPVFALHENDLIRYPDSTKFLPEKLVTRSEAAWQVAQILEKPRLMGTSKVNEFSAALKRDARRVALPRGTDFNPNLQGYDIKRQTLNISTEADESAVVLETGNDWKSVGNVRFENLLENTVTVHSTEFRLRFSRTNVGPVRYFEILVTGPGFEQVQQISRTGTAFISGVDQNILPGDEYILRIQMRPIEDSPFYQTAGDGTLSLESLTATTISSWDSNSSLQGKGNYQTTPTEIESRLLTPIRFEP
ncbi:S-layer homology domain-containing protein [bacterium]|nr:S-layer homology domain-containing protein [bacterium]MBT6831659.1 S-layer homology domain-containing protein [bacterium]MBT6996305.1 S-layer homology domain-containing protein [bacterium]MBT7772983.1 S-layer homology domain-containing protein [bacterium]